MDTLGFLYLREQQRACMECHKSDRSINLNLLFIWKTYYPTFGLEIKLPVNHIKSCGKERDNSTTLQLMKAPAS